MSVLNIVPIPKSGDLSLSGNYRGISLSSIVAKTYNRLILNRILPVLDCHLRTNQNGFRVGRTSGVATGVARGGGRVPPLTVKKLPKMGENQEKTGKIQEKSGKKEEKSGRKGKNREVPFTLPLLTDRAGYATGQYHGWTYSGSEQAYRRHQSKSTSCNNNFHWLSESFWYHPQGKDVENPESIWHTWTTCKCYWPNAWKYQNKGDITGWGNRPLWVIGCVLQGDTLAPYLFVIALDYALRTAIDGREEDLGFHLEKRKSRRVGPEVIIDLDFDDDIALLSEEIQQALELLSRVETSVGNVGLQMNASKTKFMSFNHNGNINIQTNDGTKRGNATDFKYLGALMESSEKDVKVRKAAAWRACSELNKI